VPNGILTSQAAPPTYEDVSGAAWLVNIINAISGVHHYLINQAFG